MAELRLVQFLLLHVLEAELHSVVAFLLSGLDLGYHARACFDDGYRDNLALSVEDLGHADLLADDSFVQHFCFPP